jgi:hypothetical protein
MSNDVSQKGNVALICNVDLFTIFAALGQFVSKFGLFREKQRWDIFSKLAAF